MRSWFSLLLLMAPPAFADDKLTFEDRVEIVRGMTAEYATVKVDLPQSKKALEFDSSGKYDKKAWEDAGKEKPPAARPGDLIQITKVTIENEKIELEINGGLKGGRKWYDRIQVGGGMGGNVRTGPISQQTGQPTLGTAIVILFHKPVPAMKAAELKKMLSSIMDFERRSATELYADTLPPEVQQAIKEKRAREGMDRDQVLLALGRPVHKSREVKDGQELEDWIYGKPPGRITFVTFAGDKVIKVKESYAGLGAEAAPKLPVN